MKVSKNFAKQTSTPCSHLYTVYFELGGITKHSKIGPLGNTEFCSPMSLNVPGGETKGNVEGRGVARIFQKGGHTLCQSSFLTMAKISSWHFRHLLLVVW